MAHDQHQVEARAVVDASAAERGLSERISAPDVERDGVPKSTVQAPAVRWVQRDPVVDEGSLEGEPMLVVVVHDTVMRGRRVHLDRDPYPNT